MTREITKTENATPKTNGRFVWIFFGFLIVFVYFFALDIPLLGPDEPRYAQVAREMLERGDWITPTLGGFNWFEKPPLLYWLEMASYKIFGITEFAARLGSALFGLGTIVSLWLLGRSLEKENDSINSYAHYLALMAASTLGIIVFSRAASFDIIVTFPITAALVSFFIFHRTSPRRVSLSLVLFYFFVGIALLAKGLIGIVFPFAIVTLFFLLSRRFPSRTFILSIFWGTLLSHTVAAIWYLPMYQRHGFEFIDEFFLQHHFQRFTSNKYQHPQPFYFYLWVLPLMTLPWLPFFFASIWNFIKTFLPNNALEVAENSGTVSIRTFAFAWLLIPLIFFSFSGSKLPGYILPAVPAAIILASAHMFQLMQNSGKWRKVIVAIATTSFAVTILLLIFAVPRFADTDSVRSLVQAANSSGYLTNRLIMLHTLSHNAEFYAAGRLLRDIDGKQKRLSGVNEVMAEIKAENGRPVLVLLPLEYLPQLTTDENLRTQVLKDNGELAIAAVSLR